MIDRKTALEKLKGHVKPDTTSWKERAKWRKDNKVWLRRSQGIALSILHVLEDNNMQQKDLAVLMGVTPQQVSKWVKGKENFTLDTIGRIEKALGIQLLQVPLVIKEEVHVKSPVSSFKKVKSLGGPKVIKLTSISTSGVDKIA